MYVCPGSCISDVLHFPKVDYQRNLDQRGKMLILISGK